MILRKALSRSAQNVLGLGLVFSLWANSTPGGQLGAPVFKLPLSDRAGPLAPLPPPGPLHFASLHSWPWRCGAGSS